MASNRSPSPLSSRTCRNPVTNPTPRNSFNGNFSRPSSLINPKIPNPPPPATDHVKRNSVIRKSTSSLYQDGKENPKDALRSPAKLGSKNFMAPTISAASKFTPSPRKRILGEKNDLTRASAGSDHCVVKDLGFKCEAPSFEDGSLESKTVEEKEIVFVSKPAGNEVTLVSDESTELLSGCTEDSDIVSVRPVCCSPITSPIIAPLDSDPDLPPYDPKNNFLSPRPRFLRYKPNPRIENILNKESSDEDDITRLEGSFNLSDNSSDSEVVEQEKESESDDSVHGSSDNLVDDSVHGSSDDSVRGSSDDLTGKVLEEKEIDLKVEKASKSRFFAGSKAISFVFLMFLVGCYSVSFTDLPPMDLPIYKDVGFSEIYHESLKFAGYAKESFDVLVENVKNWSIDFGFYILDQKSQFFRAHKSTPIRFINLTVQEEFVFNRHIGTDYIQEVREYEEEMSDETELVEEVEEDFAEMMEDDYDIEAADEANEILCDDEDFVEAKSDHEDAFVSVPEPAYEAQSEVEVNDLEIVADMEDSHDEPEVMSSMPTESLDRICLAGFSMVVIAVSAVIYLNNRKSNAKKLATVRVANDSTCDESCSSSVGNGHKKKTGSNRRESFAVSSSDYSMGSYGSFTTLERIPIRNKDEVMLTPIRRSSRLLKNQVS